MNFFFSLISACILLLQFKSHVKVADAMQIDMKHGLLLLNRFLFSPIGNNLLFTWSWMDLFYSYKDELDFEPQYRHINSHILGHFNYTRSCFSTLPRIFNAICHEHPYGPISIKENCSDRHRIAIKYLFIGQLFR